MTFPKTEINGVPVIGYSRVKEPHKIGVTRYRLAPAEAGGDETEICIDDDGNECEFLIDNLPRAERLKVTRKNA